MVIGILAAFGALIPYSTGEKYGYLITVFLALVFYLELLSSEIAPAGENDLPLTLYVLYTTAAILLHSILDTILWGKKYKLYNINFLKKFCPQKMIISRHVRRYQTSTGLFPKIYGTIRINSTWTSIE